MKRLHAGGWHKQILPIVPCSVWEGPRGITVQKRAETVAFPLDDEESEIFRVAVP